MDLHWMALSALLIACIGFLMGRRPENVPIAWIALIAAVVLIMARGYYWHVFPRGEGFWTLNRTSAAALLLICLSAGRALGEEIMSQHHKARADRK